jgi:hypothetical protein
MIRIEGSSEIYPSGFGTLVQTDRVGGSLSHNITETLSVSLNGDLYFVSGITTEASIRDFPSSRFFSISPSMSWKFADWWSIGVSYAYAERNFLDSNQRFDSNAMFIMLTYEGEKWSVSR